MLDFAHRNRPATQARESMNRRILKQKGSHLESTDQGLEMDRGAELEMVGVAEVLTAGLAVPQVAGEQSKNYTNLL